MICALCHNRPALNGCDTCDLCTEVTTNAARDMDPPGCTERSAAHRSPDSGPLNPHASAGTGEGRPGYSPRTSSSPVNPPTITTETTNTTETTSGRTNSPDPAVRCSRDAFLANRSRVCARRALGLSASSGGGRGAGQRLAGSRTSATNCHPSRPSLSFGRAVAGAAFTVRVFLLREV
jgi:hypothetical protein